MSLSIKSSLNSLFHSVSQFSGLIWLKLVVPVTPLAAGVAAGGPSAGPVAFGVARVFPGQGSHMFVGVGSPHSAEKREKHKKWVIKLPDNALKKKKIALRLCLHPRNGF